MSDWKLRPIRFLFSRKTRGSRLVPSSGLPKTKGATATRMSTTWTLSGEGQRHSVGLDVPTRLGSDGRTAGTLVPLGRLLRPREPKACESLNGFDFILISPENLKLLQKIGISRIQTDWQSSTLCQSSNLQRFRLGRLEPRRGFSEPLIRFNKKTLTVTPEH